MSWYLYLIDPLFFIPLGIFVGLKWNDWIRSKKNVFPARCTCGRLVYTDQIGFLPDIVYEMREKGDKK
ncbi:MAG: hypothetical protein ABFD07_12715 [Methanobacterium sp.]